MLQNAARSAASIPAPLGSGLGSPLMSLRCSRATSAPKRSMRSKCNGLDRKKASYAFFLTSQSQSEPNPSEDDVRGLRRMLEITFVDAQLLRTAKAFIEFRQGMLLEISTRKLGPR